MFYDTIHSVQIKYQILEILNNISMEKFIITRTDNPYLLNCILSVVGKNEDFVTLEYTDFGLEKKQIVVNLSDGEFYTDEVIERRRKDLALRNIHSLMEYHGITPTDILESYQIVMDLKNN